MGLPTVNLPFQNGNLGLVDIPEDGIFGLVVSAEANAASPIGGVYSARSMADVAALGIIDSVNNHFYYKFLKEFFSEGGEGTKIWIMPIARTELMSTQYTPDVSGNVPVKKMLDIANGEISLIFNIWNPDNTITLTEEDGLDEDVWLTVSLAQEICDIYTEAYKSPVSVITEGYNFTGAHADLPDLNTMTNNRSQIFIGNTEKRTGPTSAKGASLGAYAGRLAKIKVSTNPGRKKDGPLYDVQVYIKDTPVEEYDITSLHDKGYVTLRRHVKSSGYYITDCPMACSSTDDYGFLTRRRVIDKAFRLGYQVAAQEILEDFSLTTSGTIDPLYAKQLESNMINAVYLGMTLNGELSADLSNPNDFGCVCKVDLSYPTGQTGQIQFLAFQVQPRGYANIINVPIGFVPFNS